MNDTVFQNTDCYQISISVENKGSIMPGFAYKLEEMEGGEIDKLVRPCKMKIMGGYIFRQSNPAIVGVDILSGTLKIGMPGEVVFK